MKVAGSEGNLIEPCKQVFTSQSQLRMNEIVYITPFPPAKRYS